MFLKLIYLYFVRFIYLCDGKEEEKVFGGRLARKGEFPSAVAIMSTTLCGGTIFALDKVLTAGHCMVDAKTRVPKSIDIYKIIGGALQIPLHPNFITGEGAQLRKISSVKIHEGFKLKKDKSSYNDIAFIILTEPFVESATLSVAKFPSKNEKEFFEAWKALVPAGKKCIGVGWGSTTTMKDSTGKDVTDPKSVSEFLKAIDLSPVDQKTCSRYAWREDEDMTEKGEVCVSSNKEKGESVCKGDSGSPLYCDGYAFALARAVQGCGSEIEGQFYVLFGPYFDYFGIGIGSLLSTNIRLPFMISMIILQQNEA